jgi:hypothetical protein
MATYYRIQRAHLDPKLLLDPAHQTSLSYCTDTERRGVSVCDSLEALAGYLAATGIPFTADDVVVGLDGDWSTDVPEDEHLGELLIHPTRIISVEPMTDRLDALIDAALENA